VLSLVVLDAGETPADVSDEAGERQSSNGLSIVPWMSQGADPPVPEQTGLERHASLDERFDPAVRIFAHDPKWAAQAEAEMHLIADVLGAIVLRLEHVGSTAVPGLGAKPILDLQLSLERLEPRTAFVEPLEGLGYLFVPDPASTDYLLFAKPAQRPRSHHLHVCEAGGEHESRHLALRDFLRANADEARRYESLKREVAERSPEDRLAYIAGKQQYVDALEARALTWAQSAG
jgi:GrpB-like predicted nucleotidyltransferase (UPF0157 family)